MRDEGFEMTNFKFVIWKPDNFCPSLLPPDIFVFAWLARSTAPHPEVWRGGVGRAEALAVRYRIYPPGWEQLVERKTKRGF